MCEEGLRAQLKSLRKHKADPVDPWGVWESTTQQTRLQKVLSGHPVGSEKGLLVQLEAPKFPWAGDVLCFYLGSFGVSCCGSSLG